MIKRLEKWGILTFHPGIKTHKQKQYALVLAFGLALLTALAITTAICLVGCLGNR